MLITGSSKCAGNILAPNIFTKHMLIQHWLQQLIKQQHIQTQMWILPWLHIFQSTTYTKKTDVNSALVEKQID